MKVVLLENDSYQAESIRQVLESGHDIQVEHIATEYDFRQSLQWMAAAPPAVIVLDVMVNWTVPERYVPQPPDVARDRHFTAGLRCYQLLITDTRTANIPVIFYTGCNERDIEDAIQAGAHFLSKDYGDHRPLLREIRVLAARNQ